MGHQSWASISAALIMVSVSKISSENEHVFLSHQQQQQQNAPLVVVVKEF